ncbi:MAG: archease [Melioribacter sp.]|uniref:archease n=1 Tax=Rosettibacter primus TaxID=3111523 RepID=UPI00247C0272|nr:archease [Melioribacter sp.]
MPYKFIEHTADIAIEVEGKTIEDVFISAFYAWKEIVLETTNIKNEQSKKFIFNSKTLEELLIEFLGELNYQLYTKKWVVNSINKILIEKTSELFHLDFEVFGESLKNKNHLVKEEIKAVTFHQMKIEEKNGNLSTIIVFDI